MCGGRLQATLHTVGCYGRDNEKRAESLMVHWEMVLKRANLDGAKRGVFFAGAQAKDPAFLETTS